MKGDSEGLNRPTPIIETRVEEGNFYLHRPNYSVHPYLKKKIKLPFLFFSPHLLSPNVSSSEPPPPPLSPLRHRPLPSRLIHLLSDTAPFSLPPFSHLLFGTAPFPLPDTPVSHLLSSLSPPPSPTAPHSPLLALSQPPSPHLLPISRHWLRRPLAPFGQTGPNGGPPFDLVWSNGGPPFGPNGPPFSLVWPNGGPPFGPVWPNIGPLFGLVYQAEHNGLCSAKQDRTKALCSALLG